MRQKVRFLRISQLLIRTQLTFVGILLLFVSNAQTAYFRVINGIPHLPVFADAADASASVGTADPGMFFYSDKDTKILYFNGTSWVSFCSTVSWTGADNYFQIKKGVPIFPSRDTSPTSPPSGGIFFSTKEKSLMMGDGNRSFHRMKDMRSSAGNFSEKKGFSSIGNGENLLELPVLMAPLPTDGVEKGAVCINGTEKTISYFDGKGWHLVDCSAECESEVIVDHKFGVGIAPESKTLIYGTVTNIPGEPTKCWTTKNLGADSQASSEKDDIQSVAGWYWQFNRKQGYKHDGASRLPSTAWINPINENVNWQDVNDPCVLELKNGWRLPTYTEWYNVNQAGGWNDLIGTWNSGLKLHAAGYLSEANGALLSRGAEGSYASSSIRTEEWCYALQMSGSYSSVNWRFKHQASSVRCIKDIKYVAGVPNQPGPINGATNICTKDCRTYTISPVSGAKGYNWSFSGTGVIQVSADGLSCTVCPTSIGDFYGGILRVVAYNENGASTPTEFYIEVSVYTISYGNICRTGQAGQKANMYFTYQGQGSSVSEGSFIVKDERGILTADLVVDQETGQIDVYASQTGGYYVCYEAPNGCQACCRVTICDAPVSPAVAYPDSHVCQYPNTVLSPSLFTPSPENSEPFSGGTTLGGFTSDDGLVIDYLTGAINVAASTVGTHTITYTPNPLCCPNVKATTMIRIDALPTFSASVTQATCAKPTGDITLAIELHSPIPAPTAPSPQVLYPPDHTGGYVRLSDLSVTTSCGYNYVTWYDAPFGGSSLDENTRLVSGRTYYASQCGSEARVAIVYQESSVPVAAPVPAAPSVYPPQTPCVWEIYNSKGVLVRSGTRNADGAVIASGLEPGVYYCQVTNVETGCASNSVVVTIVAPHCLTYTLIPNCASGMTDVEFCITTLVTTAEPITNWTLTGNGTNDVFTGNCMTIKNLAPGTYSYTVKTASGESVTVSFTVEKVKCCPPEIALGAFDCATKKGVVTISVPKGIAGASWNYTFKNPDGSITNGTNISTGGTLSLSLSPGTYVFTFTDVNGKCDPVTITVTIECSPNCGCATPIWAITKAGTCSDKTTEVTISNLPGAVGWTIKPGNGTGTTTSTVLKLLPGTYTYTVTSADGCTSDPITIVIPCPAGCGCEALTYSVVRQPSCVNETADVVIGNLPSGNWTINPGNVQGTGGSFYPVCCLAPGTYSYRVTDENNCTSAVLEFTVKCAEKCTDGCVVPPTYTITQPTCSDKRTIINIGHLSKDGWSISGSDGSSYSGTSLAQTIYLTPGSKVTYTIKDISGNVLFVLTVIAEEPNCPCYISPVLVTNAGACGSKGTVTISNLPITGWKITYDGSTVVTGASASKTISLAPNEDKLIEILNTAAGCSPVSYTVKIPCPTGCKPSIYVARDATCDDKTGDIVVSNLPTSGNWSISPGVPSGSGAFYVFYKLSPGVHTYTFTDQYKCPWDAVSAVITEPDCTDCGWSLKATVIQPTCDAKGSITLTGWPSADISITSADGDHSIYSSPVPYEPSYTYSNLSPGMHSFTVTDVHTGCSKTLDVDLVYPKCCPPNYTITCVDGVPIVTFTLNGVKDSEKVVWLLEYNEAGKPFKVQVDGSSTVLPLTAGQKYTFTYTIDGCDPIEITVNAVCPSGPGVKFNKMPDCGGSVSEVDFTLTDLPEGGYITGVSYSYTHGTVSSEGKSLGTIPYGGTSSEFNKLTSYGVYVYTVYDKDGKVVKTVTVPVFPIDSKITIDVVDMDCSSGTGSFTVNPTGTNDDWTVYIGSYKQTGTSPLKFTGIPAGTYWVVVIDNVTGCMSYKQITVCP